MLAGKGPVLDVGSGVNCVTDLHSKAVRRIWAVLKKNIARAEVAMQDIFVVKVLQPASKLKGCGEDNAHVWFPLGP